MSGQHTLGPWHILPADEWTSNHGMHAQFGRYDISAGGVDPRSDDYYLVGSVSNVNNSDANRANARLIAAAPDMLEALRDARDMIALERQSFADCNNVPELTDGDDTDNFVQIGGALFERHDAEVVADYDRALAKIDAAIAKATTGEGA